MTAIDSRPAGNAHATQPLLTRPDGSALRLLVVDDEPSIRELLALALRYEGWDVTTAADGAEAVEASRGQLPDAVLLDMMLPDMDGTEVLRRLRTDNPRLPVIFVSAKDAVEDRVAGLTAGGDDYVTKPFSLVEVAARVRGVLGRIVRGPEDGLLAVGDLVLDEELHEVNRGGADIRLTATEFQLLRYLMLNPGRVLSKAQIRDRVWSHDVGGQDNVVELFISSLRRKVDAGRTPMIHTVRGAGYVMRSGRP